MEVPPSGSRETGADVLGRFRYQAEVAALHALGMLSPGCTYDQLYLEWHEDFIIVQRDGKRIPVQVKTREEHLAEFHLNDETFRKVLLKFDQYLRRFPDQVSKFVFASNRTTEASLHSMASECAKFQLNGRNATSRPKNKFKESKGEYYIFLKDYAVHCGFGKDPTALSDTEKDALWDRFILLFGLLEIGTDLPKLPHSTSTVRDSLVRHVPALKNLPIEELDKRAETLIREIFDRSRQRYDVEALITLAGGEIQAGNEIGITRRLRASEVRQILGVEILPGGQSRSDLFRGELEQHIQRLPDTRRFHIAHVLHLPVGDTVSLTHAISSALMSADINTAVNAVEEIEPEGTEIAKRLCLYRLLSDTDADDSNERLGQESQKIVAAQTSGKYKYDSGRAFILSSRLTTKPWRTINMDSHITEMPVDEAKRRLLDILSESINPGQRGVDLKAAVEKLLRRNVRLVLITCPDGGVDELMRILTHLPHQIRALFVIPSGVEHGISAEVATLPPPDPDADECYMSLCL